MMMAVSLAEKQRIREETLQERRRMAEKDVAEKSAAITEKLLALPEFRKANTVMFYHSTKKEAGTREAISAAFKAGKAVLLPVTDENEILACEYKEDEELVAGRYGVLEPKEKRAAEEFDLAVVPGIAFDKEGGRIGYGKGYYDRFLKEVRAKKIGLAFDSQLVQKIPMSDKDVPMDIIITESKVIRNEKK
ncbi:5-formyltetrahydrofolate cyclo-ligase [Candidatus Woesearchaeota archaeon]|nr:5-formyltetrahydrofolate cyclo-ligase [Candidatus Woesearchaeota archaeon]